jgi:hypothetical protein
MRCRMRRRSFPYRFMPSARATWRAIWSEYTAPAFQFAMNRRVDPPAQRSARTLFQRGTEKRYLSSTSYRRAEGELMRHEDRRVESGRARC